MEETKVVPIRPEEVSKKMAALIPPFVIEVFNTLIAQNFDSHLGKASFSQEEVVKAIIKWNNDLKREDVFTKHWLDVEDIYREVGWGVRYDKPAYNEEGVAWFEFSTPKKLHK